MATILPPSYIFPEEERPRLDEVIYDAPIPVVDLSDPDRSNILKQIGCACAEYGAFQIRNHRIEEEPIKAMLDVAYELFKLPPEEKTKLHSDGIMQEIRLSTDLNATEESVHQWGDYRKRQWKDCVRLRRSPLENFVPECFRDVLKKYCMGTRNLGFKLFELLSESLGLETDHIAKVVGGSGQNQDLTVSVYPPCPQPELTYGHQPHTDHSICTILLQDQVGGLQILHNGKWLQVQPHPGAFIVIIGDLLQALSNAKYKSVWHRVIVNANQARASVASFLCPFTTSVIAAPKELLINEAPVYRTFLYGEYKKNFLSRNVNQKCCLDIFKVGADENGDRAATA